MTTTPTSEYLSLDELRSLTAFASRALQAVWLTKQNIPYLNDGKRVIVSRVHVMARLEGRIVASSSGLNLGAIK